MMGCGKCKTMCGLLMLLFGVLFLLQDLKIWDFWNIQWWTVMFLLFGLGSAAGSKCPDCRAMCDGPKKSK